MHRLLCLLAFTACAVDPTDPELAELSEIDSELTAAQWGDGILVKDQYGEAHTDGLIAISSYANKLWAVYPVNDTGLLRTIKFDGTRWLRAGDITHTDDGYGLVVYNNLLTAIVVNGSSWFMFTRSNDQYARWSDPIQLTPSHRTQSSHIGLAVHGGRLYVASTDNFTVILDRLDGTTLTRIWSHELENTFDGSVSLASFGGKLHGYWVDPTITEGWTFPYGTWGEIWHYTVRELIATPGSTYVVDNNIGMESISTPAVTVCNGYAHMIHGGSSINSTEIWWSAMSTTAATWGNDYKLPNRTSLRPSIACNAYVIPTMLYGSADTERMWYAEFR
jgi:hypothetical protein